MISAGQSAASLKRPGMDRVRDLLAAGGVSEVLTQASARNLGYELDKLAQGPGKIIFSGRLSRS
jgi:hypothetical protein